MILTVKLLMFQSTHPVWGATYIRYNIHKGHTVSIHAPRVGCDMDFCQDYLRILSVSIHAPRVGCDIYNDWFRNSLVQFQSTHPVWGATGSSLDAILQAKFQSTHPVWGATAGVYNS